MRERTCCFTGHRNLPVACREELTEKLEETIVRLIQDGIQFFEAGGALGFDYEKGKVMRSEILEAAPKSSR